MERLDARLAPAIEQAQLIYGAKSIGDRFRGLYLNQDQLERLLKLPPAEPTLSTEDAAASSLPANSPLVWLANNYGLDDFELDILLLALAPELDRRYERVYAFLQDHVSRRLPSIDLALNLLCNNAADRLNRRRYFNADAPLFKEQLLQMVPDGTVSTNTLLTHFLKLDPQVTALLLQSDFHDSRLVPWTRLEQTDSLNPPQLANLSLDPQREGLLAIAQTAGGRMQPAGALFHFVGKAGTGRFATAQFLAHQLGRPLLHAGFPQLLAQPFAPGEGLDLAFRQSWWQEQLLYLDNLDSLVGHATVQDHLVQRLQHINSVVILAGETNTLPRSHAPINIVTLEFGPLSPLARRELWQINLEKLGRKPDPALIVELADRFQLGPDQISQALLDAANQSRWQAAVDKTKPQIPGREALFAAARAQTGHRLAILAQKLNLTYGWDDLVLPEEAMKQLKQICARMRRREKVLGEWGFEAHLPAGKGLHALFAGPSGTGKSMAATVIAADLGLDLFRIDLSSVVSKYIGETEKNLEQIFTAAENSNAILFFDEADALFGKRSEVNDSHDRYANIEISYLLQRMESYGGMSILATNLRQNLDDAFTRRLAFQIHFAFPGSVQRAAIWRQIWPEKLPLAPGLDFDWLGEQFRLSGGNIKNAALAAAYLAADDGGCVTMPLLEEAIRDEYNKIGRRFNLVEPVNGRDA